MMLMEASDSPDPDSFKDTVLFKKCLELGIIPATEDDIKVITEDSGDSIPDDLTETDIEPIKEGLELSIRIHDMWCPACSWP